MKTNKLTATLLLAIMVIAMLPSVLAAKSKDTSNEGYCAITFEKATKTYTGTWLSKAQRESLTKEDMKTIKYLKLFKNVKSAGQYCENVAAAKTRMAKWRGF